MARLLNDGSWRTAPGPGDLPARTTDPRNETPGGCAECDGRHPTNRCPHLVRATKENR